MAKNILVTGAAGNVGLQVTEDLLGAGHNVHATVEPRNEASQAQQLRQLPGSERLHIHPLDAMQEAEVAQFFRDQPAPFDGAALLAGGFAMKKLSQTSGDDLDRMLRLNFHTAFFCARELLQSMKDAGGGRIALIGARPAAEHEEGHGVAAYAFSKTLVRKLGALINDEGRSYGIIATVISPDMVDTAPNREAMPNARFGLWIKPAEISRLVQFALSEDVARVHHPEFRLYGNP